uniref:neurogenic locus notch homolog protein 1-like n=1 Tax=Styela clava TaxID=7725 RepID=UPI00193A9C04|nr:neurogenic locus notch homolog protein 1-like [Styela clava]
MKTVFVVVAIICGVCEGQFNLAEFGSCNKRCGVVGLPCACIKNCKSAFCCKDFDEYCTNNNLGTISSLSDLLSGQNVGNIRVITIGSPDNNQNQNTGSSQIFCSNPAPISNGRHSGTRTFYTLDSSITYTCDSGYTMKGIPKRTCTFDILGPLSGGSPGLRWTPKAPTCESNTPVGCNPRNCGFVPLCYNPNCPAYPNAVCKPSYCDCTENYEVNGQSVNCNEQLCEPRNCGIVPLCYRSNCPAYPYAECKSSYCDCREWYEVNGQRVNCGGGGNDPCQNNNCHENADCIPNGQFQFTCRCKSGYDGNGYRCTGYDPCQNNNCHENADCIPNGQFQFTCRCKSGYDGNGYQCRGYDSCQNNNCHENADCIPNGQFQFTCRCKSGYDGNGYQCRGNDPCQINNCHENADCIPNGQYQFTCRCKRGYEGNGYQCRDYTQTEQPCEPRNCGIVPLCYRPNCPAYPYAECKSSYCGCREWYEVNGQQVNCGGAVNFAGTENDPCQNNDCHEHADCIPNGQFQFTCQCKSDYDGNGYECTPTDPCLENDCHENANCFPTGQFGFSCQCKNGYEGDGRDSCGGSCKGRCGSYEGACLCTDCDQFSSRCCDDYQSVCARINPSLSSDFGQQKPQFSCKKPGFIEGGTHSGVSQTSFPVGSTIYYNCFIGYSIVGARQRTCSQSSFGFGQNAEWIPAAPTCESGGNDPCQNNNCHENADCIPNGQFQFTCRCKSGYDGNGYRCTDADPCSGINCHQSSFCRPESGEPVCFCIKQQWECDSYCQPEPNSYLDGELAINSGKFAESKGNLPAELRVEYDIVTYYISVEETDSASEHVINVAKLLDSKNLWTLGTQLQQQYFQSSVPLQKAMLAYFVGVLGDITWANNQFNFMQTIFADAMDGPVGDIIKDIDQDLQILYQEKENGGNGQQQQGGQANDKLAEAIESEMEIIVRIKTSIGWSCSKDLVIYMGELLKAFKPDGLSGKLKELLKKKLIRRNPISRAIILYLLGKTDPAELACSLRALEMIKKSVVGECRSFISALITSLKKKDKFKKEDVVKTYLKKIESLATSKPEKACYFVDSLLSILSGMDPQKRPEIVKLLESLLENKNTNSDAVLRYLIAKLDPNKAKENRDKMVQIQAVLKKKGKDYLVTKLLDNL